jgi:exosortase/archaeosortase family protein
MEKVNVLLQNKKNIVSTLIFILRAIIIYQVLVFIFHGYIALIDPNGRFNFSQSLGSINLVQVLRDSIILPSSFILEFIGYQTKITEVNVGIIGTGGVEMIYGCLGFESWAALACLLFAYSDKSLLKNKLNYFLICVLAMQILNILRITGVAVVSTISRNVALYHHEAYNLVIYGFVILCFYYWIEKTKKDGGNARAI